MTGVTRAVDLCAAPGSWSQVLAKELRHRSQEEPKIVAVDIQTMAPLDGVKLIQGDITSIETAHKVIGEFEGNTVQLVVCDGAPDVTGQHDLDEFMQSQLLLAALNITTFIIQQGGTFVAKIFRGKDVTLMMAQFKLFFNQVQVVKPKSSRTSSIEAFIVCHGFQMPKGYKPHMFDMSWKAEDQRPALQPDSCMRHFIPFLMCGDLNQLPV